MAAQVFLEITFCARQPPDSFTNALYERNRLTAAQITAVRDGPCLVAAGPVGG